MPAKQNKNDLTLLIAITKIIEYDGKIISHPGFSFHAQFNGHQRRADGHIGIAE